VICIWTTALDLQSLNVFKKLYMIETLHSMLLTNFFVLFPPLVCKIKILGSYHLIITTSTKTIMKPNIFNEVSSRFLSPYFDSFIMVLNF